MDFDVVVWDFDGVVNGNVVDGRLLWADDFEEDIGHDRDGFVRAVFNDNFARVLRGDIDLLDHVAAWANRVGCDPRALVDYWFAKDALPDPQIGAIMRRADALGLRQVIATNNEPRRTRYIERDMGFGDRVEAIFSSGRMRCVKPEATFFERVRQELGGPAGKLGWQTLLFRDFDYSGLQSRLGLR